jgi:P-type Cu+ transporter
MQPIKLTRNKPVEIQIEIDPVCKMKVTPESAVGNFVFKDKTYYFCAVSCLNRFKQTPEKYLEPYITQQVNEKTEVEYTCPMHPEIVQNGFGMCPICGMALEPKTFSLQEDTSELDEMTRRFWISTILTLPVFAIAMSEMFVHLPSWTIYLQLILSIPIVFYCGKPFFERGIDSIKNKSPNMFTLISIGVGVAFIYSVVRLFFVNAQHSVYFEASAVIITLVLLGQILELRARSQTNTALRELLELSPKTAHVLFNDGTEAELLLEDVQLGAKIRVRANEKIPVDGVVLEGKSSVDESSISGEAMPVFKEIGAKLIGGTLNLQGSFVMKAEKIGRDTMLSNIVQMVSEAQRSKAPIQGLADKVSSYFVPIVVFTAILTLAIWSIIGNPIFGIVCSVSVLIIACPCALGLATPMSIMVGTGRGAKSGVLVRNAESLQMLEKIDVLIVDKTGTLTSGKPRVVSVSTKSSLDENEVLRFAASLEKFSEHPLANAIVKEAESRNLELKSIENFESETAKGVSGLIEGKIIRIQSAKAESSNTAVEIVVNGEIVGVIEIADTIKDSAKTAIASLRSQNIEVVMLTGDNKSVAEFVAKQVGIESFQAEVLPQDKANYIKELQAKGKIVAMAGDGVNDAVALTQADVGIAMATGTDIAIESSDITLINGDLSGILRARNLSKAVMRNIRQNLFFAFAYNFLGVPIAAGILYPFFGMLLSPMIASAAMTFSSVSVIANALRLRNARL